LALEVISRNLNTPLSLVMTPQLLHDKLAPSSLHEEKSVFLEEQERHFNLYPVKSNRSVITAEKTPMLSATINAPA